MTNGVGGALLEVRDVSRSFGGVYANRNIDLRVPPGELRGVIGPNGAGKSTLFSLIAGGIRPQSGQILLDGVRIDHLPPHRRAALGVAIVFQGARLFPSMSVLENVAVGAQARTSSGALQAVLRTRGARREELSIMTDARDALDRVGLAEWAHQSADVLPLGQQRRMQVARALVAQPRLLLLDEPASGLRESERRQFAELVSSLSADGMTILLIEHDVPLVTRLASQISVLDLGEIVAEGAPDEIRRDPRVIEAYLGGTHVE